MAKSDDSVAPSAGKGGLELIQVRTIERLERLHSELSTMREEVEFRLTRAGEAVEALRLLIKGKLEPVEEVTQLEGIAVRTEAEIKELKDSLHQVDATLEEITSAIGQIAAGEAVRLLPDRNEHDADANA